MDKFSQACKDFGITIRPTNTQVTGQDIGTPPVINIDEYKLDVVDQFTCLGSTISDEGS